MRVATNRTLDERRQYVAEMLDFIRDFNKLDTTLVKQRVWNDQKALEAAEAVLAAGVGAWKSIEALRDFCVQTMFGEKPPDGFTGSTATRVSPFSVPLPLLRAMAPNPGNFDVSTQLRSLNLVDTISLGSLAGEEKHWTKLVPQGEAWLVTSIWARGVPTTPRYTRVTAQDVGSNRILYDGLLWAWSIEAMPCFWWFSPYSPIEIRFTRQREDVEAEVLLVVEGWRFMWR